MSNPLLSTTGLPAFSQIKPEHVVPALKEVLTNYRETVERLLAENTQFNWNNLCQPLAEAGDKLSRVWSPVSHLNSVKTVLNCVKCMNKVCRCYLNLVHGWDNMKAYIKLINQLKKVLILMR
ncbi:oligopeptidase A [Proteus penneri ATCC 35198]|nr:oligopeptidase A [Proteus penneri ATCC 35198]